VVLGCDDAVILSDEVEVDIKATILEENIHTVIFNRGHYLPVVSPETLVESLREIWSYFGVV
jgi:hypothetical protein